MNQEAARDTYVASIRSDADLMSAAVRTGSTEAPIVACPGWDLRTLIEHVGFVHRWATFALRHGRAPGEGAVVAATADDNLAVWIVDGAADLIDAIQAVQPDGDTWHPFALEQKNWVWARRQALETAVHRWDAQTAVHGSARLDPELSSEGLQEYLELGIPRVLTRHGIAAPSTSLHIHCTDVDGEWLIWGADGAYRMLPIHDKGDAALRGTAEQLWLVMMGRADRDTVETVGDPSAAGAWLDLPGW